MFFYLLREKRREHFPLIWETQRRGEDKKDRFLQTLSSCGDSKTFQSRNVSGYIVTINEIKSNYCRTCS